MENVRMSDDNLQGQNNVMLEIQSNNSINRLETPRRKDKIKSRGCMIWMIKKVILNLSH